MLIPRSFSAFATSLARMPRRIWQVDDLGVLWSTRHRRSSICLAIFLLDSWLMVWTLAVLGVGNGWPPVYPAEPARGGLPFVRRRRGPVPERSAGSGLAIAVGYCIFLIFEFIGDWHWVLHRLCHRWQRIAPSQQEVPRTAGSCKRRSGR